MKALKIIKAVCVMVAIVGGIFTFCIIGRCDYEDYCNERGIECETKTSPLDSLIGVAMVAVGFGAAVGIDALQEKSRSTKQMRNGSKRRI